MKKQGMESVVLFCGNCNCGCPELFIDHDAPVEQRIVITDDFGQRIAMSVEQLGTLTADLKAGKVDHLLS